MRQCCGRNVEVGGWKVIFFHDFGGNFVFGAPVFFGDPKTLGNFEVFRLKLSVDFP